MLRNHAFHQVKQREITVSRKFLFKHPQQQFGAQFVQSNNFDFVLGQPQRVRVEIVAATNQTMWWVFFYIHVQILWICILIDKFSYCDAFTHEMETIPYVTWFLLCRELVRSFWNFQLKYLVDSGKPPVIPSGILFLACWVAALVCSPITFNLNFSLFVSMSFPLVFFSLMFMAYVNMLWYFVLYYFDYITRDDIPNAQELEQKWLSFMLRPVQLL